MIDREMSESAILEIYIHRKKMSFPYLKEQQPPLIEILHRIAHNKHLGLVGVNVNTALSKKRL